MNLENKNNSKKQPPPLLLGITTATGATAQKAKMLQNIIQNNATAISIVQNG